MNLIYYLAGYVPLVAALAVLLVIIIKKEKKANLSVTSASREYPVQQRPISGADCLLEDPPSGMQDADMEELKDRLCNLLEREKPYLNPDIRAGDIAEKLYTNSNYLAQTIKVKMNKNFCQLIHYYRVKEAMRIYSQDTDLTITQLCRRVGFNSMTTFNAAFSRNTGFTPAEWCKEYRRRNEQKDSKERN